jgi:ankyrin repeat protein
MRTLSHSIRSVVQPLIKIVLSTSLQDGMTPLHEACQGGHVEVVSVLLTAGANLEAIDNVSRCLLECL